MKCVAWDKNNTRTINNERWYLDSTLLRLTRLAWIVGEIACRMFLKIFWDGKRRWNIRKLLWHLTLLHRRFSVPACSLEMLNFIDHCYQKLNLPFLQINSTTVSWLYHTNNGIFLLLIIFLHSNQKYFS